MRLITWNINGIKTLPQYKPWNECKGNYGQMLDLLGGDIVCLQETKITKDKIERSMACPDDYDAFFSSYCRKPPKGYSGTAIYTKRAATVPLQAEEGLTGLSLSGEKDRDDLARQDRIGGYPTPAAVELSSFEMRDIDSEGRTTVVDLGLFVLINVYCPNETNSDRLTFKMAFNHLLDERVRQLIKLGREVIVVGDLNICAQTIDHCDPEKRKAEQNLDDFQAHPARAWLSAFIGASGVMIDSTRFFHPTRTNMYTHWETKINARVTNYGTRLDYILVTPGLLPWIKAADIQAHVVGSDHCPVFIDFHPEISLNDGTKQSLWEAVNPGRERVDPVPDPPRMAARYYNSFAGTQSLLKTFFVKKKDESPVQARTVTPLPAPEMRRDASTSRVSESPEAPTLASAFATIRSSKPERHATIMIEDDDDDDEIAEHPQPRSRSTSTATAQSSRPPDKRPRSDSASRSQPPKKQLNVRNGQSTLASFFADPVSGKTRRPESDTKKRRSTVPGSQSENLDEPSCSASTSQRASATASETAAQADGYERLPLQDSDPQAASQWNALFSPLAVPLCKMHKEPCTLWTVNKPGPNKGRKFYLCSRPVGQGHEEAASKNKNVILNPDYRCNHFEWSQSMGHVLAPDGLSYTVFDSEEVQQSQPFVPYAPYHGYHVRAHSSGDEYARSRQSTISQGSVIYAMPADHQQIVPPGMLPTIPQGMQYYNVCHQCQRNPCACRPMYSSQHVYDIPTYDSHWYAPWPAAPMSNSWPPQVSWRAQRPDVVSSQIGRVHPKRPPRQEASKFQAHQANQPVSGTRFVPDYRPPPLPSAWAMWVGNVSRDTTHEQFSHFFLHLPTPQSYCGSEEIATARSELRKRGGSLGHELDAAALSTTGVDSVHLLLHANCGFVNYISALHLKVGIATGNGLQLRPGCKGSKPLVCRERDDGDKTGVTSQHGFAVARSTWKTQPRNETTLNRAYRTSQDVFLIFSANGSGQFLGVARMSGSIAGSSNVNALTDKLRDEIATPTAISHTDGDVLSPDGGVPGMVPTNSPVVEEPVIISPGVARDLAPNLEKQDLSVANMAGRRPAESAATRRAREIAGNSSTSTPTSSNTGGGSSQATNTTTATSLASLVISPEKDEPVHRKAADQLSPEPSRYFALEWVAVRPLSFASTKHLKNAFNRNKEAKIGRDGTELDPLLGDALLRAFVE
ncbi:uncharacterized protein L969DRAFT_92556 [Mixia osmundae IAM 14324]|uniref:DNA-(apurinic or apyrimidinic site) endonuclease 2 n=1 Tax=Mixia osmundae (strain CBS 9802 / IAM 14324 / JCM 22182 / KY 12970) TaxID=764103 RepID=G7DXW1_MIXOS|nr:uncharacterized protein L969DRAFT_92556 [Mixia osmundae IAM 14324]KEI41324.1 hypothetical protein L969DRAFT_92556 [Mixia osmundae IAM 14324]GAA95421.1 hypothetical protein E5Q_02075 [Mixia osmundae IAM 14324]